MSEYLDDTSVEELDDSSVVELVDGSSEVVVVTDV